MICYTKFINKFTTIIFDYGGVIDRVPNTKGIGIFETLCNGLSLNLEEFKTLYFANNYRNNIQDWTHSQTLLHVVSLLAPDQQNEAQKLLQDYLARKSINQELLGIITKLKESGYQIALLSNYNSSLRNVIAKNGVKEIFGENIFISTEIGYQKPDPKIFEHTFDKLNAAPNEVIFIDDSPRSLSTAVEVGYTPIRYRDNETLLQDLRSNEIKI